MQLLKYEDTEGNTLAEDEKDETDASTKMLNMTQQTTKRRNH